MNAIAMRMIARKPELGRIGTITGQAVIFVAKSIDRGVELLDLLDSLADFSGVDQIAAHQHAADNQPDDDQHDGKLDEGKAGARFHADHDSSNWLNESLRP